MSKLAYIEQSLGANESVQERFRFHWFVWVKFWLFFVLGSLCILSGALAAASVDGAFGIVIMSIGAMLWLVAASELIRILTTEFAVTNKRGVFKTGWIARKTGELRLDAMEAVEVEQTFLGRIFNFGAIIMSGRGTNQIGFFLIRKPLEAKRKIEDTIDEFINGR